ncbi:MAG: gluconate 2-dehydrogenase subunit 3 family protein, partial [Woeseia sp.]
MDGNTVSRRLFLQGTGSLTGSAALRAGIPGLAALAQAACSARDEGAAFDNLRAGEARELEAISASILPTTDTPGAREAGVVWFIDKALGDFAAPQLDFLLGGLADFQRPIADSYAGAERYSDLDESDQEAYLTNQEDTPFFGFVRVLTLMGMFGMTSYGG